MPGVYSVKMRLSMFAEEHTNHDPEESRDFWHASDDDAIV